MEIKPFLLSDLNLRKYLQKGIILDTKPFLLFLGGIYNPEEIGNKLTKEFTKEDFDLIMILIKEAKYKIIVTPHILTESSNLIIKNMDKNYQNFFNKILNELKKENEVFVKKDEILSIKEFIRFGITDIGIIKTYEISGGLILTMDGNFEREYSKKGIPIVNFNHLRAIWWNKKRKESVLKI